MSSLSLSLSLSLYPPPTKIHHSPYRDKTRGLGDHRPPVLKFSINIYVVLYIYMKSRLNICSYFGPHEKSCFVPAPLVRFLLHQPCRHKAAIDSQKPPYTRKNLAKFSLSSPTSISRDLQNFLVCRAQMES
jgi:hypothetical protein